MNVKDMIDQSENVSRETNGDFGEIPEDHSPKKGLSIFRVEAVDKPISMYIDHPLNIAKDEDFGQGIRGVEAFVGNTNLAILDLLGFIKYLFKKSKPKVQEVEDEDQSQFMP